MTKREFKKRLKPETLKALEKLTRAKQESFDLLFAEASDSLSDGSLSAAEEFFQNPGFSVFVKRRATRSPKRFQDLLRALFEKLETGTSVPLLGNIAAELSGERFRTIERSFFMIPVDEEGCRLFDEGFFHVGTQNIKALPEYFDFCLSEEFSDLRKSIGKNKDLMRETFRRILDLLISTRRAKDAQKAAAFLCSKGMARCIAAAIAESEERQLFNKLFALLFKSGHPEVFGSAVDALARRYPSRTDLLYRRLKECWNYLTTMEPGEEATFKKFIADFGNSRDELERFIWDVTFKQDKIQHTVKAVILFTSPAFKSVLSRFSGDQAILKLLIQNIMVALMELEIRDIGSGLSPLILKLLIGLNLERNFLKRRAAFFEWLAERAPSSRLELEVIRFMLFEYIFIASRAVAQTRPQVMTKFADSLHKFFCRQVDEGFGNPRIDKKKEMDGFFTPVLTLLRARIWEPVKKKFAGNEILVEELSSMAVSLSCEDQMIEALEVLNERDISEYHSSFTDVFRNRPDRISLALAPDFWCRVSLDSAMPHIQGVTLPLVGTINVLPDDEQEASTDGKTIFLPRYISHFNDPLHPLSENRNLTLYVALALHEAGHIVGGTFAFDFRSYIAKFDRPELYHFIFNCLEDYRIESFLIRIEAHLQGRELIISMNEFFTEKGLDRPFSPVVDFLSLLTEEAGGYDRTVKEDPRYAERKTRLLAVRLPSGRFTDVRGFYDYSLARLTNLDIVNPVSACMLAGELYEVMILWPDEFLESLIAPANLPKGLTLPGRGEGVSMPLTQEELSDLYRQCNDHPADFAARQGLPLIEQAIRELSEKNSENENTKESRLIKQMVEHMLEDEEPADYTRSGTIDFSTRTKADDLSAQIQIEKAKGKKGQKTEGRKKVKVEGEKQSHVYSVDQKTGSRTKLSQLREYRISSVDPVFMAKFRKWEYIAHRVYNLLALLLPREEDQHDLSNLEGDINLDILIEILSGGNAVGSFDFLDVYRESQFSIESVIGIDASGSTAMQLTAGDSVIDVEKAFTLIFGNALRLLSGSLSVYAFNSL